VAKFGSKLGQGKEYEAALGQARMWNIQSCFMNYRFIVEENIEIDDPGPARDKLLAAETAFNRLQPFKQLARFERSFRLHNAIQKPGLREEINWLGLINGRAAQNPHANLLQGANGAFQIRGPVAEIRTEGKVNEYAVRHTRE